MSDNKETAPLLGSSKQKNKKTSSAVEQRVYTGYLIPTPPKLDTTRRKQPPPPSPKQQQQQQQHANTTTTTTTAKNTYYQHHNNTREASGDTFLSTASSTDLKHQQQQQQQQQENHRYKIFKAKLWKTNDPYHMKILFGSMYMFIILYSILIIIGPIYFKRYESYWCNTQLLNSYIAREDTKTYNNPDYDTNPCRYVRIPYLLYLSLEDCDISQRMLLSVILGGIVGYERKSADRPAGTRTMGLVSLGACFFTISSMFAFRSSTMGWDASRVTAALPSGVGFLGGALIWKGTISVMDGKQEKHQVHGLTTAASVWLSAAIGVGSGGALYAVTIYSTIIVLLLLRYGPRLYMIKEETEDDDDDDDDNDDENYNEDDDNEQKDEFPDEVDSELFKKLIMEADEKLTSVDERQSVNIPVPTPERTGMRRCKSAASRIPTYGS